MNNDALDLAIELRKEIGKAKDLTTTTNMNEVFSSAENIIGILAYLISPLVEKEQKYRSLVVIYEEEGMTHAKAEAKAKASTEYADWKKFEMLYDLAHQQVMLLKKFKDKLEDEHIRS